MDDYRIHGLLGYQPREASMRDVYAHIGGPTSPTLGARLGGRPGVVGAVGGIMDGLLGNMQRLDYEREVDQRGRQYDHDKWMRKLYEMASKFDSAKLAQIVSDIEGKYSLDEKEAAKAAMSMRRPVGR